MASSFAKIISALNRAPNNIDPSTSIFPAISKDSIEKELNLRREAERRGKDNLPPPGQEGLDEIELRIVDSVRKVRREGINAFNSQMREYASRMSALDIEGSVTSILTALTNAISDMRQLVHTATDHIFLERDHLEQLKREVDDFRERNGLRRGAHYPSSSTYVYGVLILILAIEATVNAFFFMQSNELGFIGGAGMALGISFINIAAAFLFGRFSTYVNHRSIGMKFIGASCVAMFLCLAGALNLYVGHFREAAGQYSWAEATRMAGDLFLTAFYKFDVFDSWILVALGFIFSLFAFIDGVVADDPYPRFGALWRRWRGALTAYAVEKSRHIDDLQALKNQALEAAESFRDELGAQVQNYIQAEQFRAATRAGLPIFLKETEEAARSLLATYREVNAKARNTVAPKHFSEAFTFETADTPSDEAIPYARDEMTKLISKADQQLQRKTQNTLDEFEACFLKFAAIPNVMLSEPTHETKSKEI